MNLVRLHLAYLLLTVASVLAQSQTFPIITGESLAGQKVTLPDAAHGHIAVLILGFTKASKTPTSAWAKRLAQDFGTTPAFQLYQLPVLEGVPRLIRGMVISGMKKGVPENMRNRFVPVLNGEAELKKLVSYNEPDDAYLILLDRDGGIARQIHGQLSATAYASLDSEIKSLLAQK